MRHHPVNPVSFLLEPLLDRLLYGVVRHFIIPKRRVVFQTVQLVHTVCTADNHVFLSFKGVNLTVDSKIDVRIFRLIIDLPPAKVPDSVCTHVLGTVFLISVQAE